MSKRRLASNFGLRFIVTVVEKIAAVVLLPVLVASLGVEGYGYLALVLSVALVYSNVLTLRLPIAVIRFYPGRRDAGPVVLVGLYYCAGVTLACAAGLLLFGRWASIYLFGGAGMAHLLLFAVALGLATMLYEFVTITFRAESEFRLLSVVDALERIVYVALCVLAFWRGHASVEMVCGILLVTTLGKFAVALRPALKGIRWTPPDRRLMSRMFLFSLPFLPYLGSVWLLERGSFFGLEKAGGPKVVGAYAIAFSVASVLASAMGPLQTVLYPLVRTAYDAGKTDQARELLVVALRLILWVGAFGTLSMCLGIRQLFTILSIRSTPPEMILLLALGGAIVVGLLRHLLVTVLNLEMNTKVLASTAPIVALLTMPFYILLIRYLGVRGAGLAFLFGTLLHTIILARCIPANLLPVPTGQYCLSLVGASLVAGAIQWVCAGYRPLVYITGVLASFAAFVGASYWLGALTCEEKQRIFEILSGQKRWINATVRNLTHRRTESSRATEAKRVGRLVAVDKVGERDS